MANYITSFTLSDGSKKQYDYNALGNKPSIPAEVTESTIESWGFVKESSALAKLSDTDGSYGQRVKALEDALADVVDLETQKF